MTTAPPISYARGLPFAHEEEVTRFDLRNRDVVTLAASNGGFRIEVRESSPDAWLLEVREHDSFHDALLATRAVAHTHGGTSYIPNIDSYQPGQTVHSETLSGFTLVLQRSEADVDRFWDTYAVRSSDGKTTDVQTFDPDQYLIALNAYDKLYFSIEAGNDPLQSR